MSKSAGGFLASRYWRDYSDFSDDFCQRKQQYVLSSGTCWMPQYGLLKFGSVSINLYLNINYDQVPSKSKIHNYLLYINYTISLVFWYYCNYKELQAFITLYWNVLGFQGKNEKGNLEYCFAAKICFNMKMCVSWSSMIIIKMQLTNTDEHLYYQDVFE